jgi:hypothetical protein
MGCLLATALYNFWKSAADHPINYYNRCRLHSALVRRQFPALHCTQAERNNRQNESHFGEQAVEQNLYPVDS